MKNTPLSLKILSGILVFWSVMTLLTIKFAYDVGYPLFGIVFNEVSGFMVAFLLVFLAPLVFVYSVWKRNTWGGNFGLGYTSFFAFNNLLALIFVKEVFGLPQIIVPLVANLVFFGVIYWNKSYFK
jgi:hypothetical protein